MKSPKRVAKSGDSATNPQSTIYNTEDLVDDNDGSCFSPRTIFATPSSMLCTLQFTDDRSSDHDLLIDIQTNNTSSFPEAQLLCHPSNHKHSGRNNPSSESGDIADGEESLSNFPASNFGIQKLRRR